MHLADFLKTFYKDAKVDPHEVEYVEAFGSGKQSSTTIYVPLLRTGILQIEKEGLGYSPLF